MVKKIDPPRISRIPYPTHVTRRNYHIWKHGEPLINIARRTLPKSIKIHRRKCSDKVTKIEIESFELIGKSPHVEDLKKTL